MQHRFLLIPIATLSATSAVHATTYLTVEQAQALMYPGQTLTAADVTLTPDQIAAVQKASGVDVISPTLRLWRTAGGDLFIVDKVLGKHEFITLAVSLDRIGTVKGVDILQYHESYGDQVRNAAWRAQLVGKRYGAPLRLGQDVQNISGATLSCKHVSEGIRRLLAIYDLVLAKLAA